MEEEKGTNVQPKPPIKKKPPTKKKPTVPKERPENEAIKTEIAKKEPSFDNGQINDLSGHTKTILHKEKQVTVRVNSSPEPGGADDVFVAVNGHPYQIKRDVDVIIPYSVYEALNNAKVTVYRQVKREDGEGNQLVESEVQRFSITARF